MMVNGSSRLTEFEFEISKHKHKILIGRRQAIGALFKKKIVRIPNFIYFRLFRCYLSQKGNPREIKTEDLLFSDE